MSDTADPHAADSDIRPVVAKGNSGKLGLIAFVVFAALGGAWIFSLMSEQRAALASDGGALTTQPDPSGRIASPPPLVLPFRFEDDLSRQRPALTPVVVREEAPRPIATPVRLAATPVEDPFPLPPLPEPLIREPTVVFATPSGPTELPSIGETRSADGVERITASRFENPSTTIPQGTVIPAVLETALDSTRPGGVRALVQRDIHSFDGSRVLVHRGSRLYGEYDAQLQRGQNRALIRWTRLIRPDGVTIALDSPASDPLGRAGVKGKVDGKFLQRFGGAILQSVLDIGVGVATREATDGVIVALPGSTQNVTPQVSQSDITPTLKVRHGTSVSVFVARDLDFSSVE